MSEETRGNRFIPAPGGDGLIMRRPVMIVNEAEWNGDLLYVFTDNSGGIVLLYELLELLTIVKPFYDQVPDREIEQYNEEQREAHIRWMEAAAKAPKRRQPTPPKSRPGFVYVLQAGPFYKIGLAKHVDRRIKQLATLPPFDLELVCTIAAADMYQLEADLHARFSDKNKQGEWYELDAADLAYIRSLEGVEWRI